MPEKRTILLIVAVVVIVAIALFILEKVFPWGESAAPELQLSQEEKSEVLEMVAADKTDFTMDEKWQVLQATQE